MINVIGKDSYNSGERGEGVLKLGDGDGLKCGDADGVKLGMGESIFLYEPKVSISLFAKLFWLSTVSGDTPIVNSTMIAADDISRHIDA